MPLTHVQIADLIRPHLEYDEEEGLIGRTPEERKLEKKLIKDARIQSASQSVLSAIIADKAMDQLIKGMVDRVLKDIGSP